MNNNNNNEAKRFSDCPVGAVLRVMEVKTIDSMHGKTHILNTLEGDSYFANTKVSKMLGNGEIKAPFDVTVGQHKQFANKQNETIKYREVFVC